MDLVKIQSRRDFIHAIGGQQAIARRFGMNSRQVVDFMITNGFAHKWKQRFIEEAKEHGIDPHPELLEGPKSAKKWFSTKLAIFLREIVDHHGGDFKIFSMETGIPISSLRTMCESNGHVVKSHVPLLESLANECKIPLPENWPDL